MKEEKIPFYIIYEFQFKILKDIHKDSKNK